MGKRVKYLSEAECASIKSGTLDYVNYFSPEHLPPEDLDAVSSKVALQIKYRQIETKRKGFIQSLEGSSAGISFAIPRVIKKGLD